VNINALTDGEVILLTGSWNFENIFSFTRLGSVCA